MSKALQFEWDEKKNQINLKKHRISFEEAKTVFYDDNAIVFDDPEHSEDEERFILLGMSIFGKICTVCHCVRCNETLIRIISARKATKKEADVYVERI